VSNPHGERDTSPRIVLHGRLEHPPLSLFNSHYSWVHQQAAANVEEALIFMNRFTGPRLLIGDLNTPPQSDLMGRLAKEGWTDAWAALRPGEDGYTYESHAPDKRIDYAWVSQELRPYLNGIELVTAQRNERGARLSDHLGLLVTFEWPAGGAAKRESASNEGTEPVSVI
jgi:endonuclease/exonuclease/phosphatase family metal-dependent hydrolase